MPSILSHCSKWIGRDPCQNLQLGRDHSSWATRAWAERHTGHFNPPPQAPSAGGTPTRRKQSPF